MPEPPFLLGIDYGTGGVRVGVFDREGSPVEFESVEVPTRYPRPGRSSRFTSVHVHVWV